MEDLHVWLGQTQQVVVQHVDVLHPFILHQVGETLFLDTGHIEDIGIGNHFLVEGRMLLIFDTVFVAIELIFLRHGQLLGSDEMERRVEVAHGHQQRVHRTAVFQVAHQIDVQILERSLGLIDRIEVKHTLRRMLVGTVAGIDDGDGGYLRGIDCCSLDVVAHHNDVSIV